MKSNRIIFYLLIFSTFFFESCARQFIQIGKEPYRDVQLIIDARNKMIAFSLGIVVDLDIFMRFGGPKIDSVSLSRSNSEIIWKSVKKLNVSGSAYLNYNEVNSDYVQTIPGSNEKPPTLLENVKYKISVVFEGKVIEKEFVYYPSLIYLEDDLDAK